MLQPILKGIWQILNQTESFLDNLPERTIGFNLSVAISYTNGGISLTFGIYLSEDCRAL